MAFIQLTTFIAASTDIVFNLSRNVSVHKHSMQAFKEKLVGGKTLGFLNEGETISWQAKHFFKLRTVSLQIKKMKQGELFIDEGASEDFSALRHEHYFKTCDNGTIMIDQLWYNLKWGKAGVVVANIFVTPYLQKLLVHRNTYIKRAAEGTGWKQYLA